MIIKLYKYLFISVIFSLLLSTIFLFSICWSPGDFVRRNELARNFFYPDELQSDYPKGEALGEDTDGLEFDHSEFQYLLEKYVDEHGIVDYIGLKEEEGVLDRYIDKLSSASYDQLTRYEKLALLINAYNAFTLKLILENPGIKSIQDIPSGKRWEDARWIISGEKLNLMDLEHKKIRWVFAEPRIHFALVCAANGCPELRNEVFEGSKLVEQLDDQAINFYSSESNIKLDEKKNIVYLSEILDWYKFDFAEDEKDVVLYSSRYIDEKESNYINKYINIINIKYIPYDWKLNGVWK